jgi:hypothetical protein
MGTTIVTINEVAMRYKQMLAQLRHPQPTRRLITAQILGLVDEVRALDALGRQFMQEKHPQTKKAIGLAGKHLKTLKTRGFDTIEAICQHFAVYQEVNSLREAQDNDKIKDIDRSLGSLRMKDSKSGLTQTIKMAGTVAASQMMGSGFAASMMTNSFDVGASSSLRHGNGVIRRDPPMRPTNTPIQRQVQRLHTDPDPQQRQLMLRELMGINNPAALPQMARVFFMDDDADVRKLAKEQARLLYWKLQYWYLSDDGTIEHVMQLKAMELGFDLPDDAQQQPPAQKKKKQKPEDIGEILKRAERKRRQRGQKI